MKIVVEVVYALAGEQTAVEVELEEGACAADAIAASGILRRHPGLDLGLHRIGVWGRAVAPNHTLRHRDRVEIYRPLVADPKQARRKRAAEERSRTPRR